MFNLDDLGIDIDGQTFGENLSSRKPTQSSTDVRKNPLFQFSKPNIQSNENHGGSLSFGVDGQSQSSISSLCGRRPVFESFHLSNRNSPYDSLFNESGDQTHHEETQNPQLQPGGLFSVKEKNSFPPHISPGTRSGVSINESAFNSFFDESVNPLFPEDTQSPQSRPKRTLPINERNSFPPPSLSEFRSEMTNDRHTSRSQSCPWVSSEGRTNDGCNPPDHYPPSPKKKRPDVSDGQPMNKTARVFSDLPGPAGRLAAKVRQPKASRSSISNPPSNLLSNAAHPDIMEDNDCATELSQSLKDMLLDENSSWKGFRRMLGPRLCDMMDRYCVSVIRQKICPRGTHFAKVPLFCGYVHDIAQRATTFSVTLLDFSGVIVGCIQESAMLQWRRNLEEGAVILLMKVSVLSPRGRVAYLNITSENILYVHPPMEHCENRISNSESDPSLEKPLLPSITTVTSSLTEKRLSEIEIECRSMLEKERGKLHRALPIPFPVPTPIPRYPSSVNNPQVSSRMRFENRSFRPPTSRFPPVHPPRMTAPSNVVNPSPSIVHNNSLPNRPPTSFSVRPSVQNVPRPFSNSNNSMQFNRPPQSRNMPPNAPKTIISKPSQAAELSFGIDDTMEDGMDDILSEVLDATTTSLFN